MSFPLIALPVDDDKLQRAIAAIVNREELRIVLRHVAAERLRTLEALSSIDPSDAQLPVLQGQARAYGTVIGLFNDDEE